MHTDEQKPNTTNQESKTEQIEQQDSHTITNAQELEALAAEYKKKNQQIIILDSLEPVLAEDIKQSVANLEKLINEVNEKKAIIAKQHKQIMHEVKKLMDSDQITINEKEFAQSAGNITKYTQLLDKIIQEVHQEARYFSAILHNKKPHIIRAWARDPSEPNEFIKHKIKWIKKYIKTIRKDLQVSYSRYNFSFDMQMNKLKFTATMLASLKKNKK